MLKTGAHFIRRIVSITVLAVMAGVVLYLTDLPNTMRLRTENPATSSMRTLREDQLRRSGKKPRSVMLWRNLDQISPHLVHAVVLSEDDTFYRHSGFDLEQIKRAMRVNWERKRFAFGGSTITQQLARTLYLSSRKNILRKIKEALITRRLERTLTKKRIIELYLNVVEWGPHVYGAEAASRHFFNKPAFDLTADEAIALACILPSPRKWNPLSEKEFMRRRKAILHNRMVRAGHVPAPVSPDLEQEFSMDGSTGPAAGNLLFPEETFIEDDGE